MSFIPVIKPEFSASLLQTSVSINFRNHSHNLIIHFINDENSCAAQYFCGNCDYIFCWGGSLLNINFSIYLK